VDRWESDRTDYEKKRVIQSRMSVGSHFSPTQLGFHTQLKEEKILRMVEIRESESRRIGIGFSIVRSDINQKQMD